MHALHLTVLPGEFSVCRRAPDAVAALWMMSGSFWNLSRSATELSAVVESSLVPAGEVREDGYSLIRFEGPLPFALIGILAAALVPLVAAGVSVFVMSTFDLDYVMVKRARLAEAVRALRTAGHEVSEGPWTEPKRGFT